jgi:hypothetical protein
METGARTTRLGRSFASQDGGSRHNIADLPCPFLMIYASQYEFERRKYAQDLIAFDKTFSALFSEKLRADDSEGHGPTHEEFIGLTFPLLSPRQIILSSLCHPELSKATETSHLALAYTTRIPRSRTRRINLRRQTS